MQRKRPVSEEIAIANIITLEEIVGDEIAHVGLNPRKWVDIERFWKFKFLGPRVVRSKEK
jgi:hypothetical protein